MLNTDYAKYLIKTNTQILHTSISTLNYAGCKYFVTPKPEDLIK